LRAGTSLLALFRLSVWRPPNLSLLWRTPRKRRNHDHRGPFVGEDKFAVYYNLDVTFKPTGKRTPMEEMALYEVKDGKIVREQFFYRTS
jgi:hypothetical protein